MKLCRFQPLEFSAVSIGSTPLESHPAARTGLVDQGVVRELRGGILDKPAPTGRSWPLEAIRFLPPAVPSKIVCIGRNYSEHAAELGNAPPQEPLIFLKPPSSILGPGEPIVLPPASERVDYEGELAVVISRRCFRLGPAESVPHFILGYTCLNDVTARDLQKLDVQFTRAKGFNTFCPFGPVLETDFPAGGAAVETFLNSVRKQSGHTSEMIFSVDVIIRWISQVMTLEPGDLIATGTPSGVGPLCAGDVVEVRVSSVGTLSNPVTASDPA
jgi:2-keto-4-pentenoate hydratase/2-oxohepta-3-ene-1,7-dioic acid hydratase in catechol pathway